MTYQKNNLSVVRYLRLSFLKKDVEWHALTGSADLFYGGFLAWKNSRIFAGAWLCLLRENLWLVGQCSENRSGQTEIQKSQ